MQVNSHVPCGSSPALSRRLNEVEQLYAGDPYGMAQMHWSDNAERHNPFEKGSDAWIKYEETFSNIERRFDSHH